MRKGKYFLIGMPASGKSTIGKYLSREIGVKFIDLDKTIVEEEGTSIPEIFKNKGEAYFRELERKMLLKQISSNKDYILATGGGAPCFFNNMELMNNAGITIFLSVSLDSLYKKLLKKGTHKRPLLKDLNQSELYAELEKKLEERTLFYSQAKITLEQDLSEISKRVNQIIFAIEKLEKQAKR